MKRYIFVFIVLLIASSLSMSGQETHSYFCIFGDTITLPYPTGKCIILKPSPMSSPNTPSSKIKSYSWVDIDYSDTQKFLKMTANNLIYVVKARPLVEYSFYYSQIGEVLSEEEYKKIEFTDISEALNKIKLPQNQNERSHPIGYLKKFWEVARWQHSNLHVVLYDKKRKSYYRYRVGLVVYCDETHPNATPPKEE